MFPGDDGNIIIKNEPIKTEVIDFAVNDLHNMVIKCERDDFPDSGEFNSRSKTISEYLAGGNVPFESIIVKEEPKFYVSNDSTTNLNVAQCLPDSNTEIMIKNWECYICNHVQGNVVDLRSHIRTHVAIENPLACGQCNRIFTKKRHLRQHETTHTDEKRFSCHRCDRKFASQSGVYHQQVIHKGERLFTCDQCERKFLRQSTLQQHKLIHSGIKPYSCTECGRKFADRSALRRHKQTHSKERPFACDLCDQRCSRKSTLQRHLQTHTGAKFFVCNICGKKFSRNSTLNHHKVLHSGQYPFACDKCDRKFVNRSTLNYHLKALHVDGQRPFKCVECDRSYVTKINLNQHKKTHKSKTIPLFPIDESSTLKSHQSLSQPSQEPSKKIGANVTKSKPKKRKLSKFTILMNKCKSLRKI